jgi:hypothetical protein
MVAAISNRIDFFFIRKQNIFAKIRNNIQSYDIFYYSFCRFYSFNVGAVCKKSELTPVFSDNVKFSNNSNDLHVLRELCEREGGAVAYRKEILSLRT